jgi:hypothetical protein
MAESALIGLRRTLLESGSEVDDNDLIVLINLLAYANEMVGF